MPRTKKIQPGHYVYFDPDDGSKKKKKLGGHAEGPYRVLENATRTFVIQRGTDVGHVNSDCVTRAPASLDRKLFHAQDETPDDLHEKNVDGRALLVRKLLNHRVTDTGKLEFQISWDGPYAATWEPRRNVPSELITKYFAAARRQANAAK